MADGHLALRILDGGALRIGRYYPPFAYNGHGGDAATSIPNGIGAYRRRRRAPHILDVTFDAASLRVPPVRAYFLPARAARVDIVPRALAGAIDLESGRVELQFDAAFQLAGALVPRQVYAPPPIAVATTLSTEHSRGAFRAVRGRRMQPPPPLAELDDGTPRMRCTLGGVARVPPVHDALLNWVLALPTDAVARLVAQFEWPRG